MIMKRMTCAASCPGTMFSIEPGIYTQEYGVRLEYDVYITKDKKTKIFGPVPDKILVI